MDPIAIEDPDESEIARYLAEGRRLIARAEACERALCEAGALEGHRLLAAQLLTAMRRLEQTMLRHAETRQDPRAPSPARPPAPRAGVPWPFRGRRRPEIRAS